MSCVCYIHLVSIHNKVEALVDPVVIQEVMFTHVVWVLHPLCLLIALPHTNIYRCCYFCIYNVQDEHLPPVSLISLQKVVLPNQSMTPIPPNVVTEDTPSRRTRSGHVSRAPSGLRFENNC